MPHSSRFFAAALLAGLAAACSPSSAPPPPSGAAPGRVLAIPTGAMAPDAGPEIRALSPIVGSWSLAGAETAGASPESGRGALVLTCDWFTGGRVVVCRASGSAADAPEGWVDFYGYDASARAYVAHAAYPNGTLADGTLSLEGGDFVRTVALIDGHGVPVRARLTMQGLPAGRGRFLMEYSAGNGPYTTAWAGTFARQ